MAITIGAATSGHNFANTHTLAHEVTEGTTALYVVLSVRVVSATINGCTYGGVPMEKVVEAHNEGHHRTAIFRLLSPTVGSADVVSSLSSSCHHIISAFNVSGVDPVAPDGAFATDSGDAVTSLAGNVTPSAVGDVVLVAAGCDTQHATVGNGGTITGATVLHSSNRTTVVSVIIGQLAGASPSTPVQAGYGSATNGSLAALALKPLVDVTADRLTITAGPPAEVEVGQPFGLTVAATNAAAQVDTSFDGNVTISLAEVPASGGDPELLGTLTVAAVAGVATFSGLSLAMIGEGYEIALAADGLTGTVTDPFSVVVPSGGGGSTLIISGATAVQPVTQGGTAAQRTVYFEAMDAEGAAAVLSGPAQISIDGAAPVASTNDVTRVGTTSRYKLVLDAAEVAALDRNIKVMPFGAAAHIVGGEAYVVAGAVSAAPVAPADIRTEMEGETAILGRLGATLDPEAAKFTQEALAEAPTSGTAIVDEGAIADAVRVELERASGPLDNVHTRLSSARATLLDNLSRLTVDVQDILTAAEAAESAAGALGSPLAAVKGVTDRLANTLDSEEDVFTAEALAEAPTASGEGMTDWTPTERNTILNTLSSVLNLASVAGVRVDPAALAPLAKTSDLEGLSIDTSGLADKDDVAQIRNDISAIEVEVDLSSVAKTSDLADVAKTSDLASVAKTSDLASLATNSSLTTARGDILNAIAGVAGDVEAIEVPDVSAIQAVADKLNTMLEQSGTNYRLTAAALVNGPVANLAGIAKTSDLEGVAKTSDLATVAKTSDLATVAKTSDLTPLATSAELAPLAKTSDLASVAKSAELAPLATATGVTTAVNAARDLVRGDVAALDSVVDSVGSAVASVQGSVNALPAAVAGQVTEEIADEFVEDFLGTVAIPSSGGAPAVTMRALLGTLLGGYKVQGDYLTQYDHTGATARQFLVTRDRVTGAVTGLVPVTGV